jgi:hypothetical protein
LNRRPDGLRGVHSTAFDTPSETAPLVEAKV